jgi:hypothetical protein
VSATDGLPVDVTIAYDGGRLVVRSSPDCHASIVAQDREEDGSWQEGAVVFPPSVLPGLVAALAAANAAQVAADRERKQAQDDADVDAWVDSFGGAS